MGKFYVASLICSDGILGLDLAQCFRGLEVGHFSSIFKTVS